MPYKDPDKEREATKQRVRRHRARKGEALAELSSDGEALPDPPSHDQLLRALGVQAQKGNVAAIRLLLEEYRRGNEDKPAEDSGSAIDELAQRRERAA